MGRTTQSPFVDHTRLIRSESMAEAVLVGSPAWYIWLIEATSFAFISEHGTFTAHKERRGPTREYWKAYRRRAGKLYRAYLGRSAELTIERLNAVAAELARAITSATESTDTVLSSMVRDVSDARTNQRHQSQEVSVRSNSAPVPASDDGQFLHLLATKLALPRMHAKLVTRPRLLQQLDTAIDRSQKLILITAPAGFGKTTLLVDWFASRRSEHHNVHAEEDPIPSLDLFQLAWLSLDDHDNHLGQFLAYLIAVLETARPGIGAAAWGLLRTQAAHPPVQAILTSLVNTLATPADRIVLVLDDYHTISLPGIHEAIAFLLERMPPHMHVIMTSRAEPLLPLARLRVRGLLTEVRVASLRFTHDEVVSFFEHLQDVQLPAEAVTMLETRTEGWVAGLQLAALSLQQQDPAQITTFIRDFTGSHVYVFDYLAEEVFQRQPEHVQAFLIQTAFLERLCGPLCAAVTGRDDADLLLEHLDQANVFLIRLDDHRHWYRYHHLFRDFLREHLERVEDTGARTQLALRASVWFEHQGLTGEAIEYALQAKAWTDALRYLTPLTASERLYEYYLDWPRWLAALPDTVLKEVPDLCLRCAWILTFTGHVEAAERPLHLADAVWQEAGNQPKLGEVLCWRAVVLFYRRDVPRAIQAAQQALALLPAKALEVRAIAALQLGFCYLETGQVGSAMGPLVLAHETLQYSSEIYYSSAAAFALARAYQQQGRLRRAAALYPDIIQRFGSALHQGGPAPYIYLGRLFYEWNDLSAAEQTLREGIRIGQRTGRGRYWPRAYNVLAQVLWAQGNAAQAQRMIDQSLAASMLLDSPHDIAEAKAYQAWLWLAQGDLSAAAHWSTARGLSAEDLVSYERQAEYLMFARLRIAQEQQTPGSIDLGGIVRLLERLVQAAEADERLSDRIAILALLALAHAAQRKEDKALMLLAEALKLAKPEGYMRTFIDEGAPMHSLITDLRAQVPHSHVTTQLQTYIRRLEDGPSSSVPITQQSSPGPPLLSEREHTILHLLADGQSIQEIARLLIISIHTARTHVKHLYAKLDAHNRVQALERARTLQLL